MDEEPTYALSEKPLYDPFERELRQARAYIDFALESYDNKMPLTARTALPMAISGIGRADIALDLAIDESKIHKITEGDTQ